jgi:6-phosphogluconolactonase/glucosamine-6-phosphate isomerase/deaminase
MNAEHVVVLFNGSSKKKVLQQMLQEKTDYPIEKLKYRDKPIQWVYY